MLTRFTLLGCALVLLLALLPSTASATHVSCGDVIAQDTTLDSDLVNCPGDGVVIGASGITLDLAGHTIDGTGPGDAGHGVRNAGADNVTVTNGRIQQFQRAVWILSADEPPHRPDPHRFGLGGVFEEASLTRILDNEMRSSGTGVTVWRSVELQRDSRQLDFRCHERGVVAGFPFAL